MSILIPLVFGALTAQAAPPWTTVADSQLYDALKKLDQQTNRISKIGSSCNHNFTPKVPGMLSANQKFKKLVEGLQLELRKVEYESTKKLPKEVIDDIDSCTGAFKAAISDLDGRIQVLRAAKAKIGPFTLMVKEEVTDPLKSQLSVNSENDWRLSLYCPMKSDFRNYVANFTDISRGGADFKSNAYYDATRIAQDAFHRIDDDIRHLEEPLSRMKARAYGCR